MITVCRHSDSTRLEVVVTRCGGIPILPADLQNVVHIPINFRPVVAGDSKNIESVAIRFETKPVREGIRGARGCLISIRSKRLQCILRLGESIPDKHQ